MGLKRHKSLIPFSHEHREILSFCLKIRKGVKNKEDIDSLRTLAKWFYKSYIQNHFIKEEDNLFPLMRDHLKLKQQIIEQHKELKAIFNSDLKTYDSLQELENKLNQHIRFEERIVLNQVQKTYPGNTLDQLKVTSQGPMLCFWHK